MIVGVPTEVKNREYRVGMVPGGVRKLVDAGASVVVEAGAGLGSGITDDLYEQAGAEVLGNAEEVWARADLIVKVKEPIAVEFDRMREGQILYTYLHLAAAPELTRELMKRRVSGVAYETIQLPDRSLPLLDPMSEIAGRMAVQVGAHCLEKESGGMGILMGGVPGVRRARVAILGGGTVGAAAARIALGMGAFVTVLDINVPRLVYLEEVYHGSALTTMYSHHDNIVEAVQEADLVVGAVLIPGAKAPFLVDEALVKEMAPGSVIVDVAVDQGGCVETTRPTTHDKPTFLLHDVVHYGVTNMPGAVPRTSTFALTNVTLRYALELATKGLERACREDPALAAGVNTCAGALTCAPVGQAVGIDSTPLADVLGKS